MATGGRMNTDILSDETFYLLCVVCKRKGKHTEAEKYCVECEDCYCLTCVKVHEDIPLLTGHKILGRGQFPSGSVKMVRSGKTSAQALIERCDKHAHNYIDRYCQNHDVVGCGTCMAVDHRCVSRLFLVCIGIVMGSLLVHYYHTTEQTFPRMKFHTNQKKRADQGKDDAFLEMEAKQDKKVRHFRQNCESSVHDGTFSREMLLYQAKKYKLAWKGVPKIGSTFLMQVFQILNDRANEDVFHKSRHSIHSKAVSKQKGYVNIETMQHFTVLTMARNPFSRLFSAYIDKVFLPNHLEISRHIHETQVTTPSSLAKGHVCSFNNTFEDFLSYVFDQSIQHHLTGHFGPVLTKEKCQQICTLQNIVIVKQESFSDDVEYALRLTGVEKKKFDIIYGAMHEKNVQSTIPGIVKTIYSKMSSKDKISEIPDYCLSWSIIAKRLWKAFQIQGYINEKSEFPREKFTNEKLYSDSQYLINLILSETRKHPLTHEQKVKQRTEALLRAYSTVNKSFKPKILKKYATDFTFFNYSTELPHVSR